MDGSTWRIIRLGAGFISGCICVYIARKKNKNTSIAFIAGFLGSIIAIGYYLYVKKDIISKVTGRKYISCTNCRETYLDRKTCPSCKTPNKN